MLAPIFSESLPLDVLQYVKDRRKLTDDEKHSILRIEKHRASVDFQYPKTNGRRFNPQWEEKFNWLCYSPSFDGCFRTCCLVFAPESTLNMELISMPFRDWKNAVGSQRGTLPKHVNSDIHRDALTKAEQFLAICDNKRLSFSSQVSAAYSESEERNRAILLSIIDFITSLAVRGIPLRGNWNSMEQREDGTFDYFIQWKSRFDTILKSHLDTSPRNARYLSPNIQNELISCLGNEIRYCIVKLIDKSKFYSVMADETTDESTKT